MLTHEHHALPAVFAHRADLAFDDAMRESELKARIDAFLSELTASLKHRGCALIGHIKGLVKAGENGHLVFSVTSFGEGARFQGRLRAGTSKALFTVNVIVYGVELHAVETVFRESFHRHFGQASRRHESNRA